MATACAAAIDATAAAVSLQRSEHPDLLTLVALDRRSGHVARHGDGGEEERYAVADYPATAALMTRGGSAVWRAGDPDTDPDELALLAEWNMTAVLAVASRDASGCWLVEVFADERSADPGVIEPVARVLTVHGLYGGVPADLSRSRAISAARADTFA